jgi:hypothetical protein
LASLSAFGNCNTVELACREAAQATKLQAAENDLKQLMADVTQAMEKAQAAVARIASKAGATTTETESRTSSR